MNFFLPHFFCPGELTEVKCPGQISFVAASHGAYSSADARAECNKLKLSLPSHMSDCLKYAITILPTNPLLTYKSVWGTPLFNVEGDEVHRYWRLEEADATLSQQTIVHDDAVATDVICQLSVE